MGKLLALTWHSGPSRSSQPGAQGLRAPDRQVARGLRRQTREGQVPGAAHSMGKAECFFIVGRGSGGTDTTTDTNRAAVLSSGVQGSRNHRRQRPPRCSAQWGGREPATQA